MEMVEIVKILKELGVSLGVITVSMCYLVCCVALGRVFAEIIDWLLDWRKR